MPIVEVEVEAVVDVVFVLVDKDRLRLVSLALIRDARSGAMAAGVVGTTKKKKKKNEVKHNYVAIMVIV